MRKIIIFAIISLLILSLNIGGCSKRNSDEVEKTRNETEQKTNENLDKSQEITEDEYKSLLTKNYEKYLKPIDIKDEKIEDLLDKDNNLNNDNIIQNYTNLLSDSKNNIESFKESISGLKINNQDLQNLNDNLVVLSDKLIEDIIAKQDNLDYKKEELLNSDKTTLLKYLDDELDVYINSEEAFDDNLEKIENFLGIDLSK